MTTKIGYASNAVTYGEEMASKGLWNRAPVWLGETLDRVLADPEAPIFPKDAPLRQPNCGVVAMCMFTDRAYADVAPIMGRGRSRSWTGSTYAENYRANALELGFETESKPARGYLGDFAKTTKGQKGKHLVTVRGHAVVVWDGLIFDQSFPAGATPEEHFSSNRAIKTHMVRA